MRTNRVQNILIVSVRSSCPRINCTFAQRLCPIRNNQIRIKEEIKSYSAASRAGAVRRIKRENPRCKFFKTYITLRTCQLFRINFFFAAYNINNQNSVSFLECNLRTVGNPRTRAFFDNNSIYNNTYIVFFRFCNFYFVLVKIINFIINFNPDKPFLPEFFKNVLKFTLFAPCNRCQNLNFCAFLQF